MRRIFENKRGWIRIVEAFTAILLIIGGVLLVLNRTGVLKEDISSRVYDTQITILREIQLDDDYREAITNSTTLPSTELPKVLDGSLPLSATILIAIRETIDKRTPRYLNCTGVICEMDADCPLGIDIDKDVYAQSVGVTTSVAGYNPRQLKLFCWAR